MRQDLLMADAHVVLPLHDGEKAIQAHHEKIWFLQWRSVKSVSQMRTEKRLRGITGTGFAQIINNRATVLVDTCEYPEEIDIRRAKEAKERAEEQLRQSRVFGIPPFQGISRKSHGAFESWQERYANRILMESWFLVIS